MGLSEKMLDFEKDQHERKMEAWRKKYPFASLMMSDAPDDYKLKYAEERFTPNPSR